MDMEKAYDRANREALWQVLRMYNVGGKLMNGIKSVYVNSLPCVRAKGGGNEGFRINSGVRQWCVMSPLALYVYMDVVMELKIGMGKRGVRFIEEKRKWRLPALLYADDLADLVSRRTLGRWWEGFLRCVEGED